VAATADSPASIPTLGKMPHPALAIVTGSYSILFTVKLNAVPVYPTYAPFTGLTPNPLLISTDYAISSLRLLLFTRIPQNQ